MKLILYGLGLILFISQFSRLFSSSTHMKNESVVFVTAHPDDETMFFGPTLRHVLPTAQNNTVHLLVLSNGNSEGLGELRTQETYNASARLGLTPDNVRIINDPQLQDSMEAEWDPALIAKYVTESFRDWKPQTVVTFDDYGVSGHPNHKAVSQGVMQASLQWGPEHDDFTLMQLYSVPLWRKYLFSVDGVLSKVIRNYNVHYNIISGSLDYHHVSSALHLHKSQMTWYRRIWSNLSRYMLVNDLGEVSLGRALRTDAFFTSEKANNVKRIPHEKGQNVQTSVVKPKTRSKPSVNVEQVPTEAPTEPKEPKTPVEPKEPKEPETPVEKAQKTEVLHDEL